MKKLSFKFRQNSSSDTLEEVNDLVIKTTDNTKITFNRTMSIQDAIYFIRTLTLQEIARVLLIICIHDRLKYFQSKFGEIDMLGSFYEITNVQHDLQSRKLELLNEFSNRYRQFNKNFQIDISAENSDKNNNETLYKLNHREFFRSVKNAMSNLNINNHVVRDSNLYIQDTTQLVKNLREKVELQLNNMSQYHINFVNTEIFYDNLELMLNNKKVIITSTSEEIIILTILSDSVIERVNHNNKQYFVNKAEVNLIFKKQNPSVRADKVFSDLEINDEMLFVVGEIVENVVCFDNINVALYNGLTKSDNYTGKYIEYSNVDDSYVEGNLLNGKKSGLFVFYDADKKICSESQYVDDKLHGTSETYYPNGERKTIENFECGEQTNKIEYHLNGSVKSSTEAFTIKQSTPKQIIHVEFNDNDRIIYAHVAIDYNTFSNSYNHKITILEKIWIDVSIFGISIKYDGGGTNSATYELKDTLHAIDLIKHIVKSEALRKTLIDFDTGEAKF